jgi:hypothetical protein
METLRIFEVLSVWMWTKYKEAVLKRLMIIVDDSEN